MYISTTEWRDLESGHLYNAGDPFPYDGQDIPEERITALSTAQNKAGFALIQAVDEPGKEIIEEEATPVEKPVKTAEKTGAKKSTTTTRKPRTAKAK